MLNLVIKARSLFSKDPSALPDVCVLVEVGYEHQRTIVVKQCLNPEFNASFVLYVSRFSPLLLQINLTLSDTVGLDPRVDYMHFLAKDVKRGDYMGEAWVSFAQVSDILGKAAWLPLQNEMTSVGTHVLGELQACRALFRLLVACN